MSITHVVLFKFKEDVSPETVKASCDRFFTLQSACVHPTTKKPYVLSIKGGKDSSVEGRQNGHTHGFVVEFASAEDRSYYAKSDPAHLDYVKTLGGIIEKLTVVDFASGVF